MERPERDEEREERIDNQVIVDACGPQEQAIGDWHYWAKSGHEF